MRVTFLILFGGPQNKDYSILGSILGSPYLGKLPYEGPGDHASRYLLLIARLEA